MKAHYLLAFAYTRFQQIEVHSAELEEKYWDVRLSKIENVNE